MRRSRQIASTILLAMVLFFLYFWITEPKVIDISNETRCHIVLENIVTQSGWPTWFISDFNSEIDEFQVIEIRHFGQSTLFEIQLNVDGRPESLLYNSFKNSYHATGDSAMPNYGRLHLDTVNTSCKFSKE